MGKKKRKSEIGGLKEVLPLVLVGVGLLVALWPDLKQAAYEFIDKVGYSFKKVRLKLGPATFTVPILNIKLPTSLVITVDIEIDNKNDVGIKFNGFTGKFTYGKGGTELAPISTGSFNMAANSKVVVPFVSNIDLTKKPMEFIEIVKEVRAGNLRKLWITGTMKTSVVNIPIDQEVSVFYE